VLLRDLLERELLAVIAFAAAGSVKLEFGLARFFVHYFLAFIR
jgi:hypothetical protein